MNGVSGFRVIDAVSATLLLLAAAFYIWPISVDDVSTAPAPAPSVAMQAVSPADTADANAVVNANLLSASRRAPQRRYLAPDAAAQPDFVMPPAFAIPTTAGSTDAATGGEAVDDNDAVPALYGIVTMNGAPRALLRLSPSDPNPSLLGEGDKRGAYRVISIRSNSVVLAGPSGSRTLRLARPARGDSIGKTP